MGFVVGGGVCVWAAVEVPKGVAVDVPGMCLAHAAHSHGVLEDKVDGGVLGESVGLGGWWETRECILQCVFTDRFVLGECVGDVVDCPSELG